VTSYDGDPQAAPDIEMLRDAAHAVCEEARRVRIGAAQTRWRARKQRLRARRLRRQLVAESPPALDDFVEVASVDELVEVLVLLAGRKG
jgi:hypothetical protein